tara:strand:+ start:405 stop:1592 length:1188 start_codon:yes stop_codon:yes gene_type:complete
MNNIKDLSDLSQKRILLRLDLNVPIKNGNITDDTRINKILPVIRFLIKKKSKIIVISHVGRPKGIVNKDLSLKPICENLEKKLNREIKLIKKNIFDIKRNDLFANSQDQIIFLENIRFYSEEEKNDLKFSKHLSSLGDLFVNDAFSCSHRDHASVSKIAEFLPSYAGLQLETEINALKKVTTEIKKPITCIIGGSKISTKIGIINNLIPKFNNIIIVGGMANNILKYKGHQIGNSIFENNCETLIKEIFKNSKKFNCQITYPVDVVVAKNMESKGKNKDINEVNNNEMILDIGPKTISSIKKIINNTNTILWNGPAGYFENPSFQNGTSQILEIISEKTKKDKIFSIAGGGETVAAINKFKKFESFTFVSTAGGAFLEYLEGKTLPGIKAINQNV